MERLSRFVTWELREDTFTHILQTTRLEANVSIDYYESFYVMPFNRMN